MTDEQKLDYLISAVTAMGNAINNEAPAMALWEIRLAVQMIEAWERETLAPGA